MMRNFRKPRRSPPWLTLSDLLGNSFFLITLLLGLFVYLGSKNKLPPVIDLQESSSYSFKLGSYVPSHAFAKAISTEIAPKILTLLKEYPNISSVEIIGHTDGMPSGSSSGNIDAEIVKDLTKQQSSAPYIAGSNVDLGLLRALYIKNVLANKMQQDCAKDPQKLECRKVKFRVYSGGSLINKNGEIEPANSQSDPSRRRIEIRFTR